MRGRGGVPDDHARRVPRHTAMSSADLMCFPRRAKMSSIVGSRGGPLLGVTTGSSFAGSRLSRTMISTRGPAETAGGSATGGGDGDGDVRRAKQRAHDLALCAGDCRHAAMDTPHVAHSNGLHDSVLRPQCWQ
jgi:hypothetical protein